MKTLILGYGEIGRSLDVVLGKYYQVDFLSKKSKRIRNKTYDILHVCLPAIPDFEKIVQEAVKRYQIKHTVIHSTVSPGTSRRLGAVHCPKVGMHPNLAESIRKFPVFLSGKGAHEVADYFRHCGLRVYIFDKEETTEIIKKFDTDFYRLCIEYTKEIKRHLEKRGLPFEAWTIYNQAYNDLYEGLGRKDYMRPNLVPIETKIGGHCLVPNTDLFETKFTQFLRDLNE